VPKRSLTISPDLPISQTGSIENQLTEVEEGEFKEGIYNCPDLVDHKDDDSDSGDEDSNSDDENSLPGLSNSSSHVDDDDTANQEAWEMDFDDADYNDEPVE